MSDLASGGQVFTDAATFEGIKQLLSQLGAVNASGLDGSGPEGGDARGCTSWFR